MRIIKALQLGFEKTLREKRLILYLWVINVCVSLIFTLPGFYLLKANLSRSWIASNLAKGIDLTTISDLIYRNQNLSPLMAGLVLGLILIWIPISIGITGGIFGALQSASFLRLTDFSTAAVRYFFRFFKVCLLSLLALIIILLSFSRGLSSLFNLWTEKAASAWPGFWSGIINLFLLLILYSLWRMFFDYTRVLLVLDDNRKVLKGLARSISFISSRFLAALAVFLLASLIPLALTIIYYLIIRVTPTSSLLFFWLSFLFGQIYLFLRLAGKVLTLGSCYYFARLETGSSPLKT